MSRRRRLGLIDRAMIVMIPSALTAYTIFLFLHV